MPTYYGLIQGQLGLIEKMIRDTAIAVSGHVYVYGWRTDEEVSFPLVQISPLVDSPTLIRHGGTSGQLYSNKIDYHIVYRMLATDDPSADFYMLLSGASCIVRGVYINPDTANATGWQRILVTNIDFDYVSPDINPGVVKEVAITVQCEGWFGREK